MPPALIGLMESQDPETYQIIGAAMAVHTERGCGFLEAVYKAALPIEFEKRDVQYEREVGLSTAYKGVILPVTYRVDFICSGGIVVEVKALSEKREGWIRETVGF